MQCNWCFVNSTIGITDIFRHFMFFIENIEFQPISDNVQKPQINAKYSAHKNVCNNHRIAVHYHDCCCHLLIQGSVWSFIVNWLLCFGDSLFLSLSHCFPLKLKVNGEYPFVSNSTWNFIKLIFICRNHNQPYPFKYRLKHFMLGPTKIIIIQRKTTYCMYCMNWTKQKNI